MTPTTRLLALLSLGNLVVGSSAFVVTGIVSPIAADLRVSAPAVGQAMTVYALATAMLAPLAVVFTGGWTRKRALLLAWVLVLLGNLVCATADSLTQLLLGRVLLGAGSMFTPIAAALAVASVPVSQRGKALSVVFLGMSLAYVTGVPLGAWVGLQWGWQSAIGVMAALSALMLVAVAWRVPVQLAAPGASFGGLAGIVHRPEVLAVLAMTLCYFAAIFAVFSFAGPVLTALVPMSAAQLSLTLALFGLSGVAGTLLGGALADRLGAPRSLRLMLPLLIGTMAVLPFTRGHYGWMMVVLLTWGVAGFSLMAPQQIRLAAMSPAQAPLLLSLNTSMLYFGMAVGAAAGGAAVVALGFAGLPWLGAPFALLALVILWLGVTSPTSVAVSPRSS